MNVTHQPEPKPDSFIWVWGQRLFRSGHKRINPLNPIIIRVGYGFSIIGFGSNRVDPNPIRPDLFVRSTLGPFYIVILVDFSLHIGVILSTMSPRPTQWVSPKGLSPMEIPIHHI